MKAQAPPQTSPQLNFLVAPGGYGKTWWLTAQAARLGGNRIRLDSHRLPEIEKAGLWALLSQELDALGLESPSENTAEAWIKHFSKAAVWVQIDDWHRLENQSSCLEWVQEILRCPQVPFNFTLCSRRRPDLPIAASCASGNAHYLDQEDLKWSQAQAEQEWRKAGLEWSDSALQRWQKQAGWPLGCALEIRYETGQLGESAYETLLNQAIDQLFKDLSQDWQEFMNPARLPELRRWQLAPDQWLPLWRKRLFSHLLLSAQAWLMRALQTDKSPFESQVLLERGLALCKPAEAPLRLSMLTRLAHFASLEARWSDLDQALAEAEPLLSEGYAVDKAAWYYQKANRARQLCQYQEVAQHLKALFDLRADSGAALNLQARGYILQGLSAYQQGEYAQTRRSYQQAQVLAQTEQNSQMLLELEIMLAFLDALQGQENQLPETILEQVAQEPLAAQPMMWLNLTFLRILGEHLDLKLGREILEKVRETSKALNWNFMTPLIADVEARLWRFHKSYDSALRLHEQALALLPENTFESLHARLNLALTCSRLDDKQRAIQTLEEVVKEAEQSGSFSLLREARVALQELCPESAQSKITPNRPKTLIQTPQTSSHLSIRLLGGFQIEVGEAPLTHWPRKKAKHILIQLLFHPHGMHRESLADWLSGSDDLEQALRQLDVHIHSLRKVLEPDRKGKQASEFIHFHDACYSFNWQADFFWDYQSLNEASQEWLKLRENTPDQAYLSAAKALKLYQGPLLPELDFADYWLAEREGLERKISDLVSWSVAWLCQQNRPEEAEEIADRMLSIDPCNETSFAALLEIATFRKSLGRLKRIYHQMEEAFARKWETPPPEELEMLYKRLEKKLS
ncbi:hypothetical protein COW36_04155 [bacterium (Candidatus Blackallbacteria) CG17_big_fil_post_rev_8_21_14_2_50_48_46]|uniref:Bacterial transcriptional activator domain-containing protein n=1 Tax=bacterium (Candidatus Blackallbacteria) CG17_big_fil_post_rev_8_21_14_2_50_48_46 TaxID=2014261 RepID=A0A2M7G8X0_9BACT|nr:MAG: hypothetical protein COW64_04790 [bacterium (Candidatus Blackallbacteria) CG18_big_fil_WC_8_21_14_2_50_49_26]PIW18491.1 MAG: hypothetical protein COW36_04155 [bacterium (Candidatus Blackallbacteria) CG17_big_fil_post_rev_8_21_14_2_50_48_46]PIW46524.1 MAG: hypothetical protein COW20_16525 [bacterium (Candidatus Blackallbacteria) CG13_big_fil_rev_8_21_14_2_50_49_14]